MVEPQLDSVAAMLERIPDSLPTVMGPDDWTHPITKIERLIKRFNYVSSKRLKSYCLHNYWIQSVFCIHKFICSR